MGKSDRKYSQDDDNDITDSDGGNDSDFSPKIKETRQENSKEKRHNYNVPRRKCEGVKKDGKLKIKIKNRNRKTTRSRSISRTPPQTTAPRRKTPNDSLPTVKTSTIVKHTRPQFINNRESNLIPFHNQNEPNQKIISLQKKVNEILKVLSKPLPDSFRRIGSTFVVENSYQPPVGVLLTMLMKAAIDEIPTRNTSVSIILMILIRD